MVDPLGISVAIVSVVGDILNRLQAFRQLSFRWDERMKKHLNEAQQQAVNLQLIFNLLQRLEPDGNIHDLVGMVEELDHVLKNIPRMDSPYFPAGKLSVRQKRNLESEIMEATEIMRGLSRNVLL
jgi:hypothetical protein